MGVRERLFGSGWGGIGGAAARAGTGGAPATTTHPAGPVEVIPVPWLDTVAALGVSAIWRCVTLIADAISDMPWTEWNGDGADAVQIAPSRLTRRPLATQTRRWWTWRVVATEALFNTAYCLHTGGYDSRGQPWSLLPIPPAAIMPTRIPDPWGLLPPTEFLIAGAMKVTDSQLTAIHRAPVPNIPDYLAGILDIARRQFTAYLAAD